MRLSPPLAWLAAATLAPLAATQDAPRAYAGLALRDNPEGTVVSLVGPGPFEGDGTRSPSLWRGDVVTSANGQPVDAAGFRALVEALRPGDELTLVYRRRSDAEAHLGDAVPSGDPNGEERSVTVRLHSREEWTGSIGKPVRADARIDPPREGEFERTLLERAAKVGLREGADGVDALLAYFAGVQDGTLDANTSPLVAQALRRPLSLDAVEAALARKVQELAGAERPDAGAWAALAREAIDGQALPVNAAAHAEHASAWRECAVALVRSHRDSVSVSPANARQTLALLRASPEIASQALARSHAALSSASNAERELAQHPKGVPPELRERVELAVRGPVESAFELDGALCVVGGGGPNVYDMTALARVFERGGDDRYEWRAPFSGAEQLVFDLSGDDVYESFADFAGPGVAVFGTALIDDRSGADRYLTRRCFAQACGLFGVGLLVDRRGDDLYESTSGDSGYAQGVGYWGAGVLLDLAGDDRYVGEKLCQGVGGPRGFGALIDVAGRDDYRADGPSFPSVYGTAGAFVGMSQGMGYGLRGSAAGGVGALFDLAGDDRYVVGEFGQGCGYFFALGLLHDARGADEYVGQRYAQGTGAHQAAGILVDERGDDRYACRQVAFQGGAWDQTVAWLLDRAGDDVYTGQGLGQGAAAQQAIGVLVDLAGRDRYDSPQAQGESGTNEYHYDADKLFSFSVLYDRGGAQDEYSCGRPNEAVTHVRDTSAPGPRSAWRAHGLCIDE